MAVILVHEQSLVSLGLNKGLQFYYSSPDVIFGVGDIFESSPIKYQLHHQQKLLLDLQV